MLEAHAERFEVSFHEREKGGERKKKMESVRERSDFRLIHTNTDVIT